MPWSLCIQTCKTFALPCADLLVCKDVLMHWPLNEIQRFITRHLFRFKYCLLNHSLAPKNKEIDRLGGFRGIDLLAAPFDLASTLGARSVLQYQADTFKDVLFVDNSVESLIQRHKTKFDHLVSLMHESGEKVEGNCMYNHLETNFQTELKQLHNKRENLVTLARSATHQQDSTLPPRFLEIGFNAGHSALLFLAAHPTAVLTCMDIGCHRYTRPCFDYLKEQFAGRIQLLIGDSNQLLRGLEASQIFDLIHIDGGHAENIVRNDVLQCLKHTQQGSVVIFDDTNMSHIEGLFQTCVQLGWLRPVTKHLLPTTGTVSPHQVGEIQVEFNRPVNPLLNRILILQYDNRGEIYPNFCTPIKSMPSCMDMITSSSVRIAMYRCLRIG